MVRALAVPEAKELACPALIKLYHQIPAQDFNLRWILGNTVAVVATKADIPNLFNIVQDPKNGASREMFIVVLRHLEAKEAISILEPLTRDAAPLIRIEATRTLEALQKV